MKDTRVAQTATRSGWLWPDSLLLSLGISFVIGILYLISVVGPKPLNPRNVAWLHGDAATYYIGWEMLRQDPHLHWPLTFTDNIGYPAGTSVAFFDLNPLYAAISKLLSYIITTPFQYFGIALGLTCSLQFFFATLLFRRLLGRNLWTVLLPSLFFLISPIMTFRLGVHYAIANHWLILAAFMLCISLLEATEVERRRLAVWYCVLAAVAVGINPYMGAMVAVVLTASIVWALLRRQTGWRNAGLLLGAVIGGLVISAYILGFLRGGGGFAGAGYRQYSLNVLAPVNPSPLGARFLPNLPMQTGQYEGYNYLGAGVLLLALIALPGFALTILRDKRRRPAMIALVLLSAAITIFAMSTKIYAGDVLIADLDPREHLSAYLGIFRSSGRFFWIVNYLILLTTLVAVFRKWNIRTSATIVAIALAIQWIDTSPTRNQWVHQDGPVAPIPALKSAVWHSMGKVHRNLIVLPPWQCGWESSPGQRDGFATFGLLAVEQRMRINSFYAARYSARDLQENCSDPPAKLARDGLPRDSVYVVTPRIASLITAGRSGRDACHVIDDFTVCSSATDFGLPPASAPQPALLPSNGALPAWSDPGVAKFLVSGWNGVEPWGSWSKGNALLEFRVTPEQAGASKSIRLKLQLLVGPKDVRYEIQSAGFSVSGSFPGGSIPRIEVFPAQFPISVVKGGVVRITLITAEAVRPIDIGLNGDSRVLGVALMGLALVNP